MFCLLSSTPNRIDQALPGSQLAMCNTTEGADLGARVLTDQAQSNQRSAVLVTVRRPLSSLSRH